MSLAPATDFAQMVMVARTVKFHVKRPLRAQRYVTLRREMYGEGREAAVQASLLRRASRRVIPGSYRGMLRCDGPCSEGRIVRRQADVLKRRIDR